MTMYRIEQCCTLCVINIHCIFFYCFDAVCYVDRLVSYSRFTPLDPTQQDFFGVLHLWRELDNHSEHVQTATKSVHTSSCDAARQFCPIGSSSVNWVLGICGCMLYCIHLRHSKMRKSSENLTFLYTSNMQTVFVNNTAFCSCGSSSHLSGDSNTVVFRQCYAIADLASCYYLGLALSILFLQQIYALHDVYTFCLVCS